MPIFLILFTVLATSCTKRDPAPELLDTIYLDLKNELEIAQKNYAAEEVQNKKSKAEFLQVVPQTGQIKIASKRVFESNNNLDLYAQQIKYFEIGLELRKNIARARYLESLTKNGRPWPDDKEIADYKIRLKLQKEKLSWGKKPEVAEKPKDVPHGTSGGEKPATPEAHH